MALLRWKSHPHTPASLPVLWPQQRGRREREGGREGEQAGWEGGWIEGGGREGYERK